MAINATGPLDGRDFCGFVARIRRDAVSAGVAVSFESGESCGHEPSLTRYASTAAVCCAALAGLFCFVAAPERFWLWALALTIDLGTPLMSTRHLIEVPHDAAHLPERYGLFSIILLGESMVAVMTGMSHQEYTGVRSPLPLRSWASRWYSRSGGGASTASRPSPNASCDRHATQCGFTSGATRICRSISASPSPASVSSTSSRPGRENPFIAPTC